MTTPKTRATAFRIDASERMPSGFLRVKGNLTKTGVFEYAFGDEMVREARTPVEVFREDSLDTLLGAPVTIDQGRYAPHVAFGSDPATLTNLTHAAYDTLSCAESYAVSTNRERKRIC